MGLQVNRFTGLQVRELAFKPVNLLTRKPAYLIFALLSLSSTALADQYVCPSSYQTVMTGYTTAQVAGACGQPTTVSSQTTSQTTPITYTQWVYTTPLRTFSQNSMSTPKLFITFKDDKVTEIVTNSQTTTALFNCYSSGRIAVGNTLQQVQIACGSPSSVNSVQKGVSESVPVTIWTYNLGAYKPTIIFTFKNDKLDTIRMGGMGK